jgi:predicted Zn-dependent peptidase
MYQKTTLENGIRVITEQIDISNAVSIGVLIETGPRDEPINKCGVAHLSEHLMFQGTSNRDALQIARMMDGAGGYMGGFTSRDYTCYSATVLSDYTTYVLDLLGDILVNSIFPEESVTKEKESVLCEIEAAQDQPSVRVAHLLRSTRWPNHSLGQPVAGYNHTVNKLTREDIIYFVHQNYLPNKIIIAASGKINHQHFINQTRDAFWRMIGEKPPLSYRLPETELKIVTESLPVSQAYFSLGIRACPYVDSNRYLLHVLNKIIGGGISSRLFRTIREEKGLVYDISSEYLAYFEDGILIVEGSTIPEYLQTVLEQIILELKKLFSYEVPIDDEELLIAKTHLKGQHIISGENVDTRMNRLATQELYFQRYIPSNEITEAIETVELDALRNLVQTTLYTNLSNATLSVVGPSIDDHFSRDKLINILTS